MIKSSSNIKRYFMGKTLLCCKFGKKGLKIIIVIND